MTETPDETQVPDAPPAPPEPSPEEAEEAEQEEQEQTLAEAAETHGSRRRGRKKQDEQDPAKPAQTHSPEQLPKLIEAAMGEYRVTLSELVGVDLKGKECPTCEGMGFTVDGGDPLAVLVHPDNLAMCEACNGYGEVRTGSRNPQHQTTVCTKCSGVGYQTIAAQPTNVTPITPQPTASTQPQMGFMNPDGTFVPFGASSPQTVPQSG
jgi:DnaJ-class molecular chaperone